MNPDWQSQQPVGLVCLPCRLFVARLVDRGRARVDDRPAVVGAKGARKRSNHQLGLTAFECAFDPVKAGFNDIVSQSKIIQALPELDKLLLLALL
jgi:hypothetical protein